MLNLDHAIEDVMKMAPLPSLPQNQQSYSFAKRLEVFW